MIKTIIDDAWHELTSSSTNSERITSLVDSCCRELQNKKIVIYPAGYMGRTLGNTLRRHGLSVTFYIDRAATIIGTVEGIAVHEPEMLTRLTSEHVVFVSVNLDYMMNQLIDIVRGYNPSLSIVNGFKANRLFCYPVCLQKLSSKETFDLIACENCGFERHGCSIAMDYLKRIARHQPMKNDWRSPSFTWFGYIAGQACTLNCIHCCEAIPFLKEHKFVPKEVIVNDVRKMAEASRFLTFVELIGGEPFLHPQFRELIEDLIEIPNIGYIKSFTNGTIVPTIDLCGILKNSRFMLQVSNYEKQAEGKLLDNIHKTRAILKEQKVPYIFTQNFEWQDFTSFDLHHTNEDKVRAVFDACTLRNCNRLYRGMLYRCPHQYAGVELGVLKRRPVECVDINACDPRELARAIEAFENVAYIDACRYCLMPFDAPSVPAGIQLQADDHRRQ